MSLYNKKVMDHFQNPRNMGRIDNPDGIGKVGNIVCGDVMHLYIKVGKNQAGEEIIEDLKYETFGCVAAISTSSIVTELAKGKKLEEAMRIDGNSITESLKGLPRTKLHCSVLAADALAESIYDYLSRNNRKIPEDLKKRHNKIERDKGILEERSTKL